MRRIGAAGSHLRIDQPISSPVASVGGLLVITSDHSGVCWRRAGRKTSQLFVVFPNRNGEPNTTNSVTREISLSEYMHRKRADEVDLSFSSSSRSFEDTHNCQSHVINWTNPPTSGAGVEAGGTSWQPFGVVEEQKSSAVWVVDQFILAPTTVVLVGDLEKFYHDFADWWGYLRWWIGGGRALLATE